MPGEREEYVVEGWPAKTDVLDTDTRLVEAAHDLD
jgi:hypothetical protein